MTQEPDLRDYLRVLRRRKGTVLLGVVFVAALAVLISLVQTPVYEGRARVLLRAPTTETLFDLNGQRVDPARSVATEILVLKSQAVRQAVKERLAGTAPLVSARAIGATDVFEIRALSGDPERAALVANTYAEAYIDVRRQRAVDDLLAASEQIQAKIVDLQAQIDAGPDSRRQGLIQAQSLFQQKLDQLQVDTALKTGGAELVTAAATPTEPVKPRPVRNVILGLIFGGVLGTGLAFLLEHLDDSVKGKEELEVATGTIVLGLIPEVKGWKTKDEPLLISAIDSGSSAAEAYRTVRTSVDFLSVDERLKALQITSASASEGKTTTMANLGVAFANAGRSVIVVCCDLRRPRLHEFYGLTNEIGFTSVLLGEASLASALQPVPGVKRLALLASGPLPPNPSELLSSKRAGEVMSQLTQAADIVLIDSPPILPVTDALVISRYVDAMLLVSEAGRTSRKDIGRAAELLRQIDAPLVGAVLNGVSSRQSYGYSYQYYHRYGPKTDPRNGDAKRTQAALVNGAAGKSGRSTNGERLRTREVSESRRRRST